MKKTVLAVALACVNLGVCFAGTMGADTQLNTQLQPFLSGEGAYTWNQLNNITVNGFTSQNTSNLWGGRVAAGFYRPILEQVSLTGESGLGYYGQTKRQIAPAGHSLDTQIYGLDLLVGAAYHFAKMGLFLKGGAMLENETVKTYSDLSKLYTGTLMNGINQSSISKLQVFPEIKVGATYSIMERLDLMVSYMHVFGSDDSSTLNLTANPGFFSFNQSAHAQNVTLDSVMFGAQYNFA